MKPSPTRYISILGTEVHAAVTTPADGKSAIKEIRQKKNEFALERRKLVYLQKKAKEAAERAEGKPRARDGGILAGLKKLFGRMQSRAPRRSLADIEKRLHDVDEILFNLDSCKVQIEGKLLHG